MWTEGLNASKCMRFKRKSISVDGALVWGYWQVKLFVQVEIHLMKPNGQGLYWQLDSSGQNRRKKKDYILNHNYNNFLKFDRCINYAIIH